MVAAQTSRAVIFCATVMLSAYTVGQQSAPNDSETLQLAQLLVDPQPEVRRQAFESLQVKGTDAFDILYQLQNSECLEQRLAIRRLLQLIEMTWTSEEISVPLQQLLVDYRRQSMVRRRALLERIEDSNQPGTAVVLANLSRFESSQDLSCQAAICLIRCCATDQSQSQLALAAIGDSQRKSCVWIRDALASGTSNPFVERWVLHLRTELDSNPQDAGPWQAELMLQLLEWSLPQMVARNQWPAANLISVQSARNCPDNLISNYADLFIQIKVWQALDELVDRYGHEFNHEPLLLYRVAAAEVLQDEPIVAFRLMKRANQIGQTAQRQLATGISLQKLGYSFVAEQVLNSVSLRPDCPLATKVRANLILAQWFSQDDRNAEASQRMAVILKQLELHDSEPSVFHQLGYRRQQLAAQQCLYQALDYLANNDSIDCESTILKGLHQDPQHTDLLILGHRFQFPDRDSADLVQELIRLRQQELLLEIAELSVQSLGQQESNRKISDHQFELAALANRYAWLTANTAGNPESALRYARLANDLVDRNPNYLDTEAKCCFVLGDINRAISLQTEACRLAGHDPSLHKQLQSFQRFQGMTPIAKIPSRLR